MSKQKPIKTSKMLWGSWGYGDWFGVELIGFKFQITLVCLFKYLSQTRMREKKEGGGGKGVPYIYLRNNVIARGTPTAPRF